VFDETGIRGDPHSTPLFRFQRRCTLVPSTKVPCWIVDASSFQRECDAAFAPMSRWTPNRMIIMDGELDELPEQAFYMKGGIDEVIEAAEKMAAGVA